VSEITNSASLYKEKSSFFGWIFLFGIFLLFLHYKTNYLAMTYDIDLIQKYVDDGLLEKNDHPLFPIAIYNYSRECQFSENWDHITLNMRGTVLDQSGNLLARTFPKFFNLEEARFTPTDDFDVYEKLDGSLGILFHYEGQWILASRGSFTSTQSLKASDLLKAYDYEKLHKDYTYLFEIIYKENRIVVEYDFENLVMLGMVHTQTGYEVDLHDPEKDIRLKNLIHNIGFKVVKKFDGVKDYQSLKSIIKDNEEGFVIRFSNGDRIKIKGEEYVRLHKLITNFSNVDIWESLSLGKDLNLMLEKVPDEFDKWVRNTIRDLKIQYQVREDRAIEIMDKRIKDKELSRKEIADILNLETSLNRSLIFAMIDGKDYSKIIWKNIKPVYQKPWWDRNS
jgi:RNA ligase